MNRPDHRPHFGYRSSISLRRPLTHLSDRPDFKVVYSNGAGAAQLGCTGDWARLIANACLAGTAVCGNGSTEGGEQCDDGNIANGDCCNSTCQYEVAGSACASDSNACTADECDGAGVCGHDPTPAGGCRTALKSLLLIKNNTTDDTKDKLNWKWLKGAATTLAELGTPTTTTEYTLCLYAGTTSAAVTIPPGSNWQALGTTGFKLKDPSGTPDGAQKALLKSGAAGKSKALVKGKGANLPDTLAPMLPLPVTAQLVNSANSVCFEAVYDSGDVKKNDATQFKAKAQ